MPYAVFMSRQEYTYILASKRKGTLYIGVTSDLTKRIWQHKNNTVEGFTKKYDVKLLVHYEAFEEITSAIEREKQLKRWRSRRTNKFSMTLERLIPCYFTNKVNALW